MLASLAGVVEQVCHEPVLAEPAAAGAVDVERRLERQAALGRRGGEPTGALPP